MSFCSVVGLENPAGKQEHRKMFCVFKSVRPEAFLMVAFPIG